LNPKKYETNFSMAGPLINGGIVFCRENLSINYSGSTYEQSRETHFLASVVRLLRSRSGRLRQSSTSAASSTSACSPAHL
jgi:hypothetical protein